MEKKFYDHLDIMNMFGCGKDRAYAIIRSIKTVSDIAKLAGKVTTSDFDKWFNMPREDATKKETVITDAGTSTDCLCYSKHHTNNA